MGEISTVHITGQCGKLSGHLLSSVSNYSTPMFTFFHFFTAAAEGSDKKHQLALSGPVCSKWWEAGYVGMGMELFMCDSGTFFPLCLQK